MRWGIRCDRGSLSQRPRCDRGALAWRLPPPSGKTLRSLRPCMAVVTADRRSFLASCGPQRTHLRLMSRAARLQLCLPAKPSDLLGFTREPPTSSRCQRPACAPAERTCTRSQVRRASPYSSWPWRGGPRPSSAPSPARSCRGWGPPLPEGGEYMPGFRLYEEWCKMFWSV